MITLPRGPLNSDRCAWKFFENKPVFGVFLDTMPKYILSWNLVRVYPIPTYCQNKPYPNALPSCPSPIPPYFGTFPILTLSQDLTERQSSVILCLRNSLGTISSVISASNQNWARKKLTLRQPTRINYNVTLDLLAGEDEHRKIWSPLGSYTIS